MEENMSFFSCCKRLGERFTEEKVKVFCAFLTGFVIVAAYNLWAPNHIQRFWCMGYAESLARSTPFSVYAETITLAPSPIVYGLPHVYLMSFLIRVGISSYLAYDLVLLFWCLLSFVCCYKICRFLTFGPLAASFLPLFVLSLPSVTVHHGYSTLGIGFMLIPCYIWAAVTLFKAGTLKEKILPAVVFPISVVTALFMDGYSFVMSAMITGGIYLAFFNKKYWKVHLFFDASLLLVSYLAAYVLYTAFIGAGWPPVPPSDFNAYQAHICSYFLPVSNTLSVIGHFFTWSSPFFRPSYAQHFLFCTPLLIANLVLLAANWHFLSRQWRYWLVWLMVIGAVWLSLGPDMPLLSGQTAPTGNKFLFQYLPGFKVMRATARWGILAHILLVALLYISLIKTRLDRCCIAVLLCLLYFFNYFPSAFYIRDMKTAATLKRKLMKDLLPDFDKRIVRGKTILFLPIRNSFSQLYFGTVRGANTWNTGCDKDIALLIKAYPAEIRSCVSNIFEETPVFRENALPAAIRIIKILLLTDVDMVVFDYNSACPLPKFPYRNPLKNAAGNIERILGRFDFIKIRHTRYFAYYGIDKSQMSREERLRLAKRTEEQLFKNFPLGISSLPAVITMDRLGNHSRGFFSPRKNGSWASDRVRISLKFQKRLFIKGTNVTVNFFLHNHLKPQRVEVFSRGKSLVSDTIRSEQYLSVPIPLQLLDSEGRICLDLNFPDALPTPGNDCIRSCFFHGVSVESTPIPLPWGQKISVRRITEFQKGFYPSESSGRWAGKVCSLSLPVPPGNRGLKLTFEGEPLGKDQFVRIMDRQNRVLGVVQLPESGEYGIVLPAENILPDNKLDLRLEFPRARRPNGGDHRILSFFFRNIKLSKADMKRLE